MSWAQGLIPHVCSETDGYQKLEVLPTYLYAFYGSWFFFFIPFAFVASEYFIRTQLGDTATEPDAGVDVLKTFEESKVSPSTTDPSSIANSPNTSEIRLAPAVQVEALASAARERKMENTTEEKQMEIAQPTALANFDPLKVQDTTPLLRKADKSMDPSIGQEVAQRMESALENNRTSPSSRNTLRRKSIVRPLDNLVGKTLFKKKNPYWWVRTTFIGFCVGNIVLTVVLGYFLVNSADTSTSGAIMPVPSTLGESIMKVLLIDGRNASQLHLRWLHHAAGNNVQFHSSEESRNNNLQSSAHPFLWVSTSVTCRPNYRQSKHY